MNNEKKSKSSKEAYAYAPGLKVKRIDLISKERRLPIYGEVLVKKGDILSYDSIVATTLISGNPHVVKVSFSLRIDPDELIDYMVKKTGDVVKKGEPIAISKGFLGWFKKSVISPIDGTVESISDLTGHVVVRSSPTRLNINAYMPGKVIEVLPEEGALIQTKATFIQGIFGIGGEAHGILKVIVESPDQTLTAEAISETDSGHILIGGSKITLDAIKQAVKVGVVGIVSGGIDPLDLIGFMNKDIGVAITGHEDLGLTLIITEGFGKITMSKITFNLLKSLDGYMASINGATQIRAGVMRPEIIIAQEKLQENVQVKDLSKGMSLGTAVRIIRQPYFGAIGFVSDLPIELKRIDTESFVRVLEVEMEDGNKIIIPRANVEIIEE